MKETGDNGKFSTLFTEQQMFYVTEIKPMSESKADKLDVLRSRPRKRPDWGAMMKEVESGNRKLKHVQCNDRSSPLLPRIKVKDRVSMKKETAVRQ
jgi:hypothetical protein